MITATIQIGNSDNKLRQNEWAQYVEETRLSVEKFANEIHFFGGAPNWYPWQNVAWVVVLYNQQLLTDMLAALANVRGRYDQESVAVTAGETQFI